MSEETLENDELELELQNAEELSGDDEYEEISSEEVDRVVDALEDLIAGIDSENIKNHLEEALNNVYYLIYDESDEEGDDELASEAA